mgnify:CR=1 FL=1
MAVDRPDAFNAWLARLEETADTDIRNYDALVEATT